MLAFRPLSERDERGGAAWHGARNRSRFFPMPYTLNFGPQKRVSSTVAAQLRAVLGKRCAQQGGGGAWVSWLSRSLLCSPCLQLQLLEGYSYLIMHPCTRFSTVSEETGGVRVAMDCGHLLSCLQEAITGGHWACVLSGEGRDWGSLVLGLR